MLELTLVVLMLADCSTCDVLNTEDVVVVLNIAEEFTVAASPNVVKGAVLELNIDKPFDFLAEANPAVDLPPNDAPFAGISNIEELGGALEAKPVNAKPLDEAGPPKLEAPDVAPEAFVANGASEPSARILLPPSAVTRSRILTRRYPMPSRSILGVSTPDSSFVVFTLTVALGANSRACPIFNLTI